MDTNNIIGYVGTGVLAITLIPQVYKTFRSKQANDLSWTYLFLQIVANILFIIYGFGIGSLPVVISNCMVSVLSLSLVFAKCKFPIGGEYTPILSVSV